jgi:hypothetical protein
MSPIIIDTVLDGRTFLELQNEALGDDFAPEKYRELVKVWMNEALRKIARRITTIGRTQSVTTAAGSATYALDGDVTRLRWVRDADTHEELDEVGWREFDALPTSSGRPRVFARTDDGLGFWPTPDAVYDIDVRHWASSVKLVDDDDTPASFGLPDDYADLLVTYARSRLFRAEDDYEAAATYKAEFESDMVRAAVDMLRTSSARKRQIPGMFAVRRAPGFQRPVR